MSTNTQGSVTNTTTNAGVVTTTRYTPYGSIRWGTTSNDRGFLNQTIDVTTGLNYLNNRFLDPVVAMFINVDPLVESTGQPYIYASGNPSSYSDPSGLCAQYSPTQGIIDDWRGPCITADTQQAVDMYTGRTPSIFDELLDSPWTPDGPVEVHDLHPLYMEMSAVGISLDFISRLANDWNGGIVNGSTKAYVVYAGGETIWVIGDGKTTSLFTTAGKGSILIAETAPDDLFKAASEMGGVWNAASTTAKALDVSSIIFGFMEGVSSSPAGSNFATHVWNGIGGALPAAAEVAWTNGVFAVGSATCALTGVGSVAAGICGAGAVLISQLLMAPLDNPGAPASYCRASYFDAAEADAMGFENTSEAVSGC